MSAGPDARNLRLVDERSVTIDSIFVAPKRSPHLQMATWLQTRSRTVPRCAPALDIIKSIDNTQLDALF